MVPHVSLQGRDKDIVAQVPQHDGEEKRQVTGKCPRRNRTRQKNTHTDQHADLSPAPVGDGGDNGATALVAMEAASASETLLISTFSPAAKTARKGYIMREEVLTTSLDMVKSATLQLRLFDEFIN